MNPLKLKGMWDTAPEKSRFPCFPQIQMKGQVLTLLGLRFKNHNRSCISKAVLVAGKGFLLSEHFSITMVR